MCAVGRAPRRGPLTPQLKRSLDTRTKNVPYTIIFKLVPKFKLLHKSEVTVAQGTLLSVDEVVKGHGGGHSGQGQTCKCSMSNAGYIVEIRCA